MISKTLDVTSDFNTDGLKNLDMSGWDYAVVHLIGTTGTVSFNTSNDADSQQGVTDGNAAMAINWVAVQGTNLSTGAAATSGASNTIWKFNVIGQFLQLTGGNPASKVLVYFTKIR